jgi:putative DNA primase/helicase
MSEGPPEFICPDCEKIFDKVESLRAHCNSTQHKLPDKHRSKPKRKFLGNKVVPGMPDLPRIPIDAKVGLITKIMADYMQRQWAFVSLSTKRTYLWIYTHELGIWENDGLDRAAEFAEKWLGRDCKDNIVNELQSRLLRRAYNSKRPKGFLGAPCKKIVVKNGVINLETFELEPFNSQNYQIVALPVTYDPNVDAPAFRRFIWQIFDTDEDMDAIMEFFGNCLTDDYTYNEIPLLEGDGANGKSVLLEILRRFLGPENVSGCTPQQLEENRYKMAQLHGKLANVAGDIPSRPLKYTGVIKLTTGGDLINAGHKNQDSFDFINRAKMIFSANQLPEAWDTTDAFHRRIRIFEMKNKFIAKEKEEGHFIDKNVLLDMLTTPEEFTGMLNLFLAGLQRLKEKGELTGSKSFTEKRIQYVKKSDPVEFMVLNYFEREPMADPIDGITLMQLYTSLCDALEKPPYNSSWFGRKLKKKAPYVEYKKTLIGDKEVMAYHGAYIDIDSLMKDTEIFQEAQDLTKFREKKRGPGTYEPTKSHLSHTGQSSFTPSLGAVVVQQQYVERGKGRKDQNEPNATLNTDEVFDQADEEAKKP